MPAPTSGGRTIRGVDVTLHASGAETATGSSAGVELGDKSTVRLDLAVTAASGTSPTLDITIEASPDNSTWTSVGTFTQATGVTTQHKVFTGLDRYVRSRRTIGGTGSPSFTYSITGEAV